jgi:hypothetical protein
MSYDIFLQGFVNGTAAEGDCGQSARSLINSAARGEQLQDSSRPGDRWGRRGRRLRRHPRGEPLTSLMFNHIKEPADGVLDLIVAVAQAAHWVILPTGAPTCLVSESQRDHLPPELADGEVRVVSNRHDLLCAIRSA